MRKKGKSFLAFFSQFHRVAFLISGILLVVALSSAYSTYTEGNAAKQNAQQTLLEFEQLVLKSDEIEPQNTSEPLITYEEVDSVDLENETEEIDDVEEEPIIEVKQIPSKPIAKLKIDKIDLNISVLSEWSYDLLEISVNKFIGPDPNELGNFIVIGHNYKNNTHFGRLDLVEIGDLVELTDLSGRTITYEVFEILIINPDEVEKLMTDNALALTLVTCDTNNKLRLVVKSKALDSE